MSKFKVNWFPGHMKKGIEDLQEALKVLDFVIEVVDARAPITTHNESLINLIKNTPLIKVANKQDLAIINEQHNDFLFLSTTKKNFKDILIKQIQNKLKLKIEKLNAKGATGYKLRGIVVGLPNVGKSSIINLLSGRNLANVQNRPGVTKKNQWLKISNNLEIWDSPGILPRNLQTNEDGYKLVAINCLEKSEELIDKTANWVFEWYLKNNNQSLFEVYKITPTLDYENFLTEMCKNKGFLLKAGKFDFQKAQEKLISDFSKGLFGKVYLD